MPIADSAQKKTRRVPIRVVRPASLSATKPVAPETSETPARSALKSESVRPMKKLASPRSTYLWWGVGVSFILLVSVWFGLNHFIHPSFSRSKADQTLANLGRSLSDLTKDVSATISNLANTNKDAQPANPEVKDLENRVFPEFSK